MTVGIMPFVLALTMTSVFLKSWLQFNGWVKGNVTKSSSLQSITIAANSKETPFQKEKKENTSSSKSSYAW